MLKTFQRILFLSSLCAAFETQAQTLSCQGKDVRTAKEDAEGLTGQLKVATFRGDIKVMTKLASQLEGYLDSCLNKPQPPANEFSCMPQRDMPATAPKLLTTDEEYSLGSICDTECHAQLARYHLFMSGDFLYLSNKADGNPHDAVKLLNMAKSHADLCGLPIIERGIKVLSRQNNTDLTEAPKNDDDTDSPFELWVRNNFSLQKLKIRLLLASGDLSYQATSDLALKNMLNGIEEAVKVDSQSQKDNTLKMAHARYRSAIWTGIELKTDIPNMTRFDDLKYVLDELLFQSKRRVNSIEKGFLYLDIDPDHFTTFRSDDLVAKLRTLEGKIKTVESAIESLFKAGQDDTKRQADEGVDEKRTINSMAVNLNATKISQLQDLAERNRLDLEGQLMGLEKDSMGIKGDILNNQLSQQELDGNIKKLDEVVSGIETRLAGFEEEKAQTSIDIAKARENIVKLEKNEALIKVDSETNNYTKDVRRLEFDLRRAIENSEAERIQIGDMKERDMIALNRSRMKEEQAKYQWLINFEITTLNLNLQIKSLGAQVISHIGSVETTLTESQNLQAQADGLYSEFRGLETEMRNIGVGMSAAFFRKHADTVFNRLETRNKICASERQLAYFGVKPTEYGFKPYGATNGALTLDKLAGSGSSGTLPRPVLVPKNDPFSYDLFSRDTYPQSCQDRHQSLFEDAGITWKTENGTDEGIFNLTEDQFPVMANYSRMSQNPLEDLSRQSLAQTSTDIDIKLIDMLNESNLPCGYEPKGMTTLLYHQTMCGGGETPVGLRKQISNENVSYAEFISSCVRPASASSSPICSRFPKSMIQLSKDVSEKNDAHVNQQIKTINDSITKLDSYVGDLKIVYHVTNNAFIVAQGLISASGAAAAAANALPKITVQAGSSGMGAHLVTTTTIDTSGAADSTFATVKAIQEMIIGGVKNEMELWEKVSELERRIADLRNSVTELNKQQEKNKVSDILTMAELNGSRIGSDHELANLRLQNDVVIEDCTKGFVDWEEQVRASVAEQQRLVVQLKQQNAQGRAIDYEIERMRLQGEEILAKEDQIRSKIDSINISMKKLRKDAERSEWQIENTVQQMCMIDQSRETIAAHNSVLSTTIELALKMIDDSAEKNIIDMEQHQLDKVAKSLRTSEDETGVLLALQNKSIELANASYTNSLGILKSQSEIATLDSMRAELERKSAALGSDRAAEKAKIAGILTKINGLVQASTKLNVTDLHLQQEQLDTKQKANAAQVAVHSDIETLRTQILKDVTTIMLETEDKKKGYLLATQQALESVAMGIPEYLEVKKRLLQEANIQLNLLRGRLNLAAGLNSQQPLLKSGAYIRSSFELDTSLDTMLTTIEENEIPVIKAPTTTLVIKQGSGFYQELLTKNKARFEVAPLTGDDEDQVQAEMERKGYYTLWSHNFRYPNLRVVDIMLSLPASCSDANTNLVSISNLGGGYVFLPTDRTGHDYEPVLVASKPRVAQSLPLHSEKDSGWNAFIEKWKILLTGNNKISDIDERIREMNRDGNNGVSGMLIGLPVNGIYEINLDANSKCRDALNTSDLKIHFNMTRDRVSGFDPI